MTQQFKKILVAVDGSIEAELAFKKAVNVAKRNQAQLIITHIIDTRAFQRVAAFDDQLADETTALAEATLKQLTEYAQNNHVPNVIGVVEFGKPKELIAHVLPQKYHIDLIVLGATGLNAVERLFIGSVSEYVIRHSASDVLVVRTDLDNKKS